MAAAVPGWLCPRVAGVRGQSEAPQGEDPAQARADFLAALGLEAEVFLSIREGAHWFERWDESKPFRVRGES